jgi:hypothetical protein
MMKSAHEEEISICDGSGPIFRQPPSLPLAHYFLPSSESSSVALSNHIVSRNPAMHIIVARLT